MSNEKIRRMIIDTDTAADDSFALLVGLLHENARLEAITIVAGNVAFEQQIENALLTVEAAGRSGEVPVHLGARVPMMRPWYQSRAHGDGKGNHDFAKPTQVPSDEAAAQALVRIVDENPGEIDILAIGPLTNIATAVLLDRDFASKVRELWIMGGCDNSVGNVTAAAEYNFFVDPEAADIVMRAGFDVTIATWTLTLAQATWSREQLAEIAAIDNDLARFFTILDKPNIDYNESEGIMGSTHPDSVTAMMLVRPDLVRSSSRKFVAIETASELTRGYSLFDDRPHRNAPNATVIDEIDEEGFFRAYVELLSSGAR
ncbi:MAG TPA: nucleoside hydrolase [Terrimesophilobacter sp.]|jgi:Inosine-uridine nucleoside N-ribohydrolase|uniref:nucleoside hydrolase n=1 Tax=Terrimesophilobacter sp. TaxID=2906435 RepID=UPI002F91D028